MCKDNGTKKPVKQRPAAMKRRGGSFALPGVGLEEEFRLLVECLRDYAIFMLDPRGYVVSWSTGAEQIKGLSKDEAVGSHYSVFYTPQEVSEGIPQNHLDEARNVGKVWSEGWRVRMDGTRFWADALMVALRESDGTLKGYAKIVRDATERHESLLAMQQAARDSDAQSRAILDTAVDAIITIDTRGRIESINRARNPDVRLSTRRSHWSQRQHADATAVPWRA